eukprot:6172012-Pleurochrysis_carterae.AAC.2
MVEYHVSVVGMSSGLSVSHKPHFVKLALLARLERRASVNGHGTSLESVHGLCCRRNVPVSGWDLSAIFDSILGVSVHICCGESWTRLPRQDMLVSSYRTWSTEFEWWHAHASYRGVSQSDASSRVKTGFITACHFALEDALRPPTKSPITFPAVYGVYIGVGRKDGAPEFLGSATFRNVTAYRGNAAVLSRGSECSADTMGALCRYADDCCCVKMKLRDNDCCIQLAFYADSDQKSSHVDGDSVGV